MNLPLPGFDRLRTRLIYLLLVALLPAFGLALYETLEIQRVEKESLKEAAVAASRLAAATQQHYINNARNLLQTLAQFPFLTLAADRRFCEAHLINLRTISPDYVDFGLIDADGKLFCSAALTNESPMLTNSSVHRSVTNRKKFWVSGFEADSIAKVPSLRMALPILDTNGTFKRTFYASLKLPLLSATLTNLALPASSTITVLDKAGTIIARFPNPDQWVGTNVAERPHVKQILEGNAKTFEASGLDGARRLFATTVVREGDEPTFFVAVGIPTATLYAETNRRLAANLAVMLFATTVAGVGAWIFARKSFLNPLIQIGQAAQRLSDHDYTARTGLKDGAQELNDLAKTFDSMAESLQKWNAELERRVRDRTALLEASNRELEAFSYSVSHDLRAPLRHMDGFAQILSSEPNLQNDERAQRYLKLIISSAKQMGLLIDDLLSFSRMGRKAMVRQSVDTNELIRAILNDSRQEQEGREIEWKIATLPAVTGDGAMLRQVWSNLISNALKYSRGRKPARIEIGSREEGDEVVFFVRDNGAGFEMKYADKLFGVFQRLHKDEEFEGTGIGLANVRRIVARHNGRTWAEGETDKGATFYFSLPKA